MVCYKCGSPYHYSDRCTNPGKSDLKCFGCGGNHKRENCPNKSSTSNSSSKCYTCKQTGHKKDQCPQRNTSISNNNNNTTIINNNNINGLVNGSRVAEMKLQLDNWWGEKSAFVHPNCPLTLLKTQFIQKLVALGKINYEQDVDTRNQISHIALGTNQATEKALYDQLNNSVLQVSVNSFQISSDCVMLPVGGGKHFTVFHKTGLRNLVGVETIKQILDEILTPYFPVAVEEEKKSSDDGNCCVCYETKSNILIEPCNHLCVCESCSARIIICPICRSSIISKKTIYCV
jgi:hypothetical protein